MSDAVRTLTTAGAWTLAASSAGLLLGGLGPLIVGATLLSSICMAGVAVTTPCLKNNLKSALKRSFGKVSDFTCGRKTETVTLAMPANKGPNERYVTLTFDKANRLAANNDQINLNTVELFQYVQVGKGWHKQIEETRGPESLTPADRAVAEEYLILRRGVLANMPH